jgi:hypothetical protein
MAGSGSFAARAYARPAVFAASALLHLALLLVLAHYLSRSPTYAEPPSLQVFLVPAPPTPKTRPPPEPDRPARQPVRQVRASPPRPDVPLSPLIPTAPPTRSLPGVDGVSANAQRALRGLVGCDTPARLTPEERERCQTRRWARPPATNPRLNLDTTGRYAENPEPYLVRKPKNGCRVRATGDTDPMGDSGNARAGVGCAFSF